MRLPDVKIPRLPSVALCFLPVIPMILVPGLGELALFAVAAILLLLSVDARRATLRWHNGNAAKEILIGLGLGVGFALFSMILLDPALGRLLQAQTDLSSFAAVRGNAKAALASAGDGLGDRWISRRDYEPWFSHRLGQQVAGTQINHSAFAAFVGRIWGSSPLSKEPSVQSALGLPGSSSA